MKKGSRSRKCGNCNRIVFWIVPDKVVSTSLMPIVSSTTRTVLDFRFRKENRDGSGHYYCMDCLRKLFPGEY